MPNPNQNEDRTLDEPAPVDDSGIDADDRREARQPRRMNQADEAIEEQQDDDPAVGAVDDDDDDDDLDEDDLEVPGVQRG